MTVENRPALPRIEYREGTYGAFLAALLAARPA
jgi:hypothetical protein